MEEVGLTKVVEWIAAALELTGVVVIAFAFLHAMLRAVLHFGQKRDDAFERLKTYLGKALQLALEFLIAADIIQTITVKPTTESLLSLGLLIVVRTVLSWSITVEIEGCWPWQVAGRRNAEVGGRRSEIRGQRSEGGGRRST